MNMLNPQQGYNHSEYIKCTEIGTFAKIYNFKDVSGAVLGRNKIFEVLRLMGVLQAKKCNKNEPYSRYSNCFKSFNKKHDQGDSFFEKPVFLVTPEGKTYLANKINDYIEETGYSVKKIKEEKQFIELLPQEIVEEKSVSSPLDYSREDALKFIQQLPEKLHNSFFASQLKEKWGFSHNEINI